MLALMKFVFAMSLFQIVTLLGFRVKVWAGDPLEAAFVHSVQLLAASLFGNYACIATDSIVA